jgi:drug/metabolite transporter (DMT)-like permease
LAYLVLCVICTTCFGLCYKVVGHRGYHAPMVQLAMFTACSAVAAACGMRAGGLVFHHWVALAGLCGGICMSLAVYTFFVAMRQGGLAVGWACVNFGVVVPVLASMIVWHEIPSSRQLAGLALLLPCILLFSDLHLQVTGDRRRWAILVAIATILSGGSSVMVKVASELPNHLPTARAAGASIRLSYLAFAYATAAIVLLLNTERKRIAVRSFETAFGIAMGMVNLAATWCLIQSLDSLPGIVVFPVKSAGGLVLTAIGAVVVWRERLTKRQVCGIALAAVSAVLINWPQSEPESDQESVLIQQGKQAPLEAQEAPAVGRGEG